MTDPIYDIALTLCNGIGPKGAMSLVELFGDAETIFSKSPSELIDAGLKPKIVNALSDETIIQRAKSIAELCQKNRVQVLVRGLSEAYPTLLSECDDAPHVLYIYGDLELNKMRLVSIIGTRKASEQGLANTSVIVNELAEAYDNIVIVSGLAFGIDSASHLAALKAKIPTVAILPGWVLDITPRTHISLARRIALSGGAIISDMPPGTNITKPHFLSRNRLVAGISSATIVVESPERSGTTSTANIANSYSRAVFALPGRSNDINSHGTNHLIKTSRAILYQDVSDLATELGWRRKSTKEVSKNVIEALPDYLKKVYESMPLSEPTTIEEICEKLEIPIGEVSSALMLLETSSLIKSIPGGMYIKALF